MEKWGGGKGGRGKNGKVNEGKKWKRRKGKRERREGEWESKEGGKWESKNGGNGKVKRENGRVKRGKMEYSTGCLSGSVLYRSMGKGGRGNQKNEFI